MTSFLFLASLLKYCNVYRDDLSTLKGSLAENLL